ncbi:glycosyltransferase family 9 protein [bacterium]|nr:MAG: glycosyltransferase family 9 protein [bacterium]
MKRFLIINPFGIGDVLFTSPVIRAIKDNYPDSFVGYWCNERVGEVLKNNPQIDRVFALSRGDLKKIFDQSVFGGIGKLLKLILSIKKSKFDISIDFSLDHRYSLISKISGIRSRYGLDYKYRGRFLTRKIGIEGYKAKHVVEYYLDLLKFSDIKPKTNKLEVFISQSQKDRSKNILARYGVKAGELVVGIAPGAGASWGKDAIYKHWAAVKFARLADRVIGDLAAKVVILGDNLERPIADIVVNTMKNKAVDLAGKTSLEELVAMISNLNILVTNDGGPLHIGVAAGIKTVSIFGPVDEKVYGPYPVSGKHIVIKRDLDCRPCYENFRFSGCNNDRKCIEDIIVDEVYEAVEKLAKS